MCSLCLCGEKSLAATDADFRASTRASHDILAAAFRAERFALSGHTKCNLVIRGERRGTHLGALELRAKHKRVKYF